MKKKLSIALVVILLLVGFTLPSPVLDVSAGLFQSPPPTGPENDNFVDATVIEGIPFLQYVDTSTASLELGEPTPGCAQDYGWSKTVWYAYTPAQSGSVTARIDYGPFALAAYIGDSLSNLTEVGSGCWVERLTFRAEAGTTYYIQFGGLYNSGGWLAFYLEGPPLNDDFTNANEISGVPFSDNVDTSTAGLETDEPMPPCASNWDRSVWYAYTPAQSGSVTARANASFYTGLAAYTGDSLNSLTIVDSRCWWEQLQLTFRAEAGTTYFFQVGGAYGEGGWLTFYLEGGPSNDDFANAIEISEVPFSDYVDTSTASLETDEPTPSCAQGDPWGTSLWYAYTPTASGLVSAHTDLYSSVLTAYTGDSLSRLIEVGYNCWGQWLTFYAEVGTTYYLQFGSLSPWHGWATFQLEVTPPPEANFDFYPYDPSVFDTVRFYNNSWDPGNVGCESAEWDFGDGAASTDYSSPTHQYAADGDYTVQLTVATSDGRSDSTTQTVSVRTHDVAIAKFLAPKAVRVGQTRSIVVGIRNVRYPERVEVQLYKSTPEGDQWLGSTMQSVPVRPARRTTDFSYTYTFTADDASAGTVTFKAVAILVDARDAQPADNEAISPPVKVTR